MWASDASPIDVGTFTAHGSIFDNIGPSEGKEDCTEMFSADGRLNDMECDLWAFRPLCQIKRKCPTDAWFFHEKFGCILHVKEEMTWPNAKIDCEGLAEQARLAEIHTKEFGLWLAEKYAHPNPWNRPASRRALHKRGSGPWIGGTDRVTVSLFRTTHIRQLQCYNR